MAPLYTFRYGKARGLGQAQDVAVAELSADPQVFIKNQLTVRGRGFVEGVGLGAARLQDAAAGNPVHQVVPGHAHRVVDVLEIARLHFPQAVDATPYQRVRLALGLSRGDPRRGSLFLCPQQLRRPSRRHPCLYRPADAPP